MAEYLSPYDLSKGRLDHQNFSMAALVPERLVSSMKKSYGDHTTAL